MPRRNILQSRVGITGLIVLCACLLPVQSSSAQDDIQTVIFPALKALYAATDGGNWTNKSNWDTTAAPASRAELNTWHGIDYDGTYLDIVLPGNNLVGAIPDALGNVSFLRKLDLGSRDDQDYNSLSGAIPDTLGGLANLTVLDLDENRLNGRIPNELGNLAMLKALDLQANNLSGTIPKELGRLSELRELMLGGSSNSNLTGPLDSLGRLTKLQVLDLENLLIEGPLPASFAQLDSLDHIDLQNNRLTDVDVLGEMTGLRTILLGYNRGLTSIPDIFDNLLDLTHLNLLGNELSGTVPSSLFKLANLRYLYLVNNQLTGEMPGDFGRLTNLQDLFLAGNEFAGGLPSELGKLTDLRRLSLDSNRLTGQLPSSLMAISGLEALYWHSNEGLCAPLVPEFQAWLQKIRLRQGENCDASDLTLGRIANQVYTQYQPIIPLELPEATGGTAPLTYSLSTPLPTGLAFDVSTRTLSGMPMAVLQATVYTYKVVDGANAEAEETFSITVNRALALSGTTVVYTQNQPITPLTLPEATGGTAPLTYSLSETLPNGLTFDAATRTLDGTPTAAQAAANYTYLVTDSNGASASATVSIEVRSTLALAPISDQIYAVGEPISPLELPDATGGRPPYAYALRPDPPTGLSFDEVSRTLSGTPTSVMKQTVYTYEVTDQDAESAAQTFTIAVGTSRALLGDRAALIALYKATDGPNWTNSTNWLKPPQEDVVFSVQELDAWYGVTAFDGRVRAVELPLNNLQGVLPPELGYLTAVDRFQLPENRLQGAIPEELEHMRSLEQLHLNSNLLSGNIPDGLGHLSGSLPPLQV